MLMLNQTAQLRLKDLNNFSLIYFININVSKIASIKKRVELHLFKQASTKSRSSLIVSEKRLILDQNYEKKNNLQQFNRTTTDYLYVPTNTFYENSGTFINTEGFFKKVTKIIYRNKIKSDWHILRKIVHYFKNQLIFFNRKDNQSLFFNLKKVRDFKTYVDFNYYPIKKLTQISF
jgi:NADH dehydrogenase/NADH:ubiquinone oxidoreductase subunit G